MPKQNTETMFANMYSTGTRIKRDVTNHLYIAKFSLFLA